MKKGLLIGGVILVVVIVAVVIFLFAGLDELVRTAVEKAGSQVTGVKVTLNKAEVSPTEGRATLRGLVVGNPAGFKTDNAFKMNAISVAIDVATVTKDPIVIKQVVVAAPEITYELGEKGSNIDVIKNNVSGPGSAAGKKSESKGPKLIIENLYIRGGKVNVSAVALGGKSMTASLPEIHLKDIGKKKGGASQAEVAESVMAALTNRVGGFVSKLDLSGVLKGVEKVPDALKGIAGGAGKKAGEAAESVSKGAGKALEGVGEGAGGAVKKLFGK